MRRRPLFSLHRTGYCQFRRGPRASVGSATMRWRNRNYKLRKIFRDSFAQQRRKLWIGRIGGHDFIRQTVLGDRLILDVDNGGADWSEIVPRNVVLAQD